ncbi:DNA-3-methyladenine glycosylase family protein [Halobacteriales archaeon Cl-PHB]
MERGALRVEELPGGLDLQATVESGQSYLWWRETGDTYGGDTVAGSDDWFVTTARATPGDDPVVVRARHRAGHLEWEAPIDAEPVLRRRLGLGDDLDAIRERSRTDDLVEAAYDAFWGLRIVRDPPFPTLITFICSAQMRVARIFGMQQALREAYGTPVSFDGETYHAYPTPSQLAQATEAELRDLGLGYRAPYVRETARMVADGVADPADAAAMDYEAAREFLTRFVGVGDKVADCVLLFSLEFLEAVPLDTWIRKTIGEYYPECDRDSYTDTSRAIRETLGPEIAGYPQTYVFHYLRTGQDAVAESP